MKLELGGTPTSLLGKLISKTKVNIDPSRQYTVAGRQYYKIISGAYRGFYVDALDRLEDTDQAETYVVHQAEYSSGIENGPVDFTGLAMLHGTPSNPEYVLNSKQAG